jgi:hypothetical protein
MHEQLKQLVDSIYAAKDEEILCADYFAQLPKYVDLEAAGRDPSADLPEIKHHIHQCPECAEVYRALLEAVSSPADQQPT